MKPAKIAVICIAALAAVGLALVVRAMGSPGREPAASVAAAVEARPMAKVLVRRESRNANSLDTLCRALASHIDKDADRRRFMAEAGF